MPPAVSVTRAPMAALFSAHRPGGAPPSGSTEPPVSQKSTSGGLANRHWEAITAQAVANDQIHGRHRGQSQRPPPRVLRLKVSESGNSAALRATCLQRARGSLDSPRSRYRRLLYVADSCRRAPWSCHPGPSPRTIDAHEARDLIARADKAHHRVLGVKEEPMG